MFVNNAFTVIVARIVLWLDLLGMAKPGISPGMATVDTEDRLADALRLLLPFAVSDEPEWAPESALAARRIAYAVAALALAEYDERHPHSGRETARVTHMLPGSAEDADALPLAA